MWRLACAAACTAGYARAQDFGSFGQIGATVPLGYPGYDIFGVPATGTLYATAGAGGGQIATLSAGAGQTVQYRSSLTNGGMGLFLGGYEFAGSLDAADPKLTGTPCAAVLRGADGVVVADLSNGAYREQKLIASSPGEEAVGLDASRDHFVVTESGGRVRVEEFDTVVCDSANVLDMANGSGFTGGCDVKDAALVRNATRPRRTGVPKQDPVLYLGCGEGYVVVALLNGTEIGRVALPGNAVPTELQQLRWASEATVVAVTTADGVHLLNASTYHTPTYAGNVAVPQATDVAVPAHMDDVMYVCSPAGVSRVAIGVPIAGRSNVTETVAAAAPCHAMNAEGEDMYVLHGDQLTALSNLEAWTAVFFDECDADSACALCPNRTCSSKEQVCEDPMPDTHNYGDWRCGCPPPTTGPWVEQAATACRLYALDDGARTNIRTFGSGSSTAGVVAMGLLTGIGEAGRLPLLRTLACGGVPSDRPYTALGHEHGFTSILGVEFGPEGGAHLVSVIVGNVALLVAAFALLAVYALILHRLALMDLERAVAVVSIPGCLYLPWMFYLHGTAYASLGLALVPKDSVAEAWSPLGIIGLVYAFATALAVGIVVLRRVATETHDQRDPRLAPVDRPDPIFVDFPPIRSACWRRVYAFLFGDTILVSADRRYWFTERYGVVFDRVHLDKAWFVAVEIGVVLLLGCVMNWAPEGKAGCSVRNFAVSGVLFAFWLLVVCARPYYAPIDNILTGGCAAAVLAAMVALSWALERRDEDGMPDASAGDWGEMFAFAAAVLVLVKVFWTVVSRLYDIASGRQAKIRRAWRVYEHQEDIQVHIISPEERAAYGVLREASHVGEPEAETAEFFGRTSSPADTPTHNARDDLLRRLLESPRTPDPRSISTTRRSSATSVLHQPPQGIAHPPLAKAPPSPSPSHPMKPSISHQLTLGSTQSTLRRTSGLADTTERHSPDGRPVVQRVPKGGKGWFEF
eukprot:TRINITY_DN3875_c2_g1_i1.p1 TRINITY_DN3875_c2_g1~~TRINITY_DN3875_c2_g1_i1.p1  ORF type:complete len:976 (+),score=199.95 TRINITY_DN3875_c2_g1_i1:65-2992(+)